MITHKPDCHGKGQCDCEPEPEAWAIQDRETGEWYRSPGTGLTKNPNEAHRLLHYYDACAVVAQYGNNDRARVVPAPPREMTDAECIEWLGSEHADGGYYSIGKRSQFWFVHHLSGSDIASARAFYDAIRAARRALEGKR